MTMPKRDGTFNALPMSMGLDETGDNSLATVQINFAVIEEVTPQGDVDCSGEGMSITGYFYLEKKDGEPNENAIKSLKSSLGWDGVDLGWFNTADVSQQPVQIVLGFEEYKGKNRVKVKYLNPLGSVGGAGEISKADPDKIKAMSNRLGSKLRAISGGTPVQTPKPQTARPTASTAPKAPATPPVGCSSDEAWAVIADTAKKLGMNEDQAAEVWFKIVAELFPAKQPDNLTPAEWAKVRAEGPAKVRFPF